VFSRIWIGTRRRSRRGIFDRYHSIENNDDRFDALGSVAVTYGEEFKLKFSFSIARFFAGGDSG